MKGVSGQHICPHCYAESLPEKGVRWSSREFPLQCKACGHLCHVLASEGNGIVAMGLLFMVLAAIAALAMDSLPAAVSLMALAVAHNLWAWQRVELAPIRDQQVSKARQAFWLWALLEFVFAAFA